MMIDGKEIKYVFIATTRDKYEHIIAMGDSVRELADELGMKKETVQVYISAHIPGYYKVALD